MQQFFFKAIGYLCCYDILQIQLISPVNNSSANTSWSIPIENIAVQNSHCYNLQNYYVAVV